MKRSKYMYVQLFLALVLVYYMISMIERIGWITKLSQPKPLICQYQDDRDGRMDASQPGRLIISEEEALRDCRRCKDTMDLPSSTESSMRMVGSGFMYKLGDSIRVFVQLNNGYGNRIKKGGHLIRATMSNKKLGAYSTGVVTEHYNGTYLVEFEALWIGKSNIHLAIDYSRVAIAASYRLRYIYHSLDVIQGTYAKGSDFETVVCHPDSVQLMEATNYTGVCNYTTLNSGYPWYCGSPSNPRLHCEDWHFTSATCLNTNFDLTECENTALQSAHKKIEQTMRVEVYSLDKEKSTSDNVIELPQQPCVKYNTTKLWYHTGQVGFFYREKWYLRHCRGVEDKSIPKCLKDTVVYLIGDSTVRQWYTDILDRFNCVQYTEPWTFPKWTKLSACRNAENNFTTIFTPHNLPYCAFTSDDTINERLTSVTKWVEKFPSSQKMIILIHMYAHMLGYHHRNFRIRMLRLREELEYLMNRYSFIKIFLKIPHTFTDVKLNCGKIDISGYIYIDIMKDVFKGMYGTVIFLDNRDATTAANCGNLHPDEFVVRAMVNQMFSYVCENE